MDYNDALTELKKAEAQLTQVKTHYHNQVVEQTIKYQEAIARWREVKIESLWQVKSGEQPPKILGRLTRLLGKLL